MRQANHDRITTRHTAMLPAARGLLADRPGVYSVMSTGPGYGALPRASGLAGGVFLGRQFTTAAASAA
jgi:hypothetical protein